MILRTRAILASFAISAAIALSARAADPVPPTTAPSTQPATVVTINGNALSTDDLDGEIRGLKNQAAANYPPELIAQLLPQIRQQAVSNLVTKQLLIQAVADRKIAVSPDEIQAAADKISKQLPPGESLDDALKGIGMTREKFNQETANSLGVEKLLAQETKAVAVTDDDITKYYNDHPSDFKRGETVSARHILIKVEKTDTPAQKADKKAKAEAIRTRLVNGEDFTKLAAENSDDPGSKDKGGLYEDFPRHQMVPQFDEAAFSQKVGDIGPVIETDFGYHIIKVEKHTDGTAIPLADIKDKLKGFLESEQKQKLAAKMLETLKSAATIQYAAGYAPPPAPTTTPTTQKD